MNSCYARVIVFWSQRQTFSSLIPIKSKKLSKPFVEPKWNFTIFNTLKTNRNLTEEKKEKKQTKKPSEYLH